MRVHAATAHVEPLPEIHRASGTVRGRATITVTSRTSGYVRAVHVAPGDHVTAGQVLIDLEANDVRAGVARARAELAHASEGQAEAASAVEAARADAELATTSRDRIAKLFASGAVTRQELDDAEARARSASAQLAMAQARLRGAASGIEAARAGLAEGQATLDYAHVVAPFAGRVVDRRVDAGALAAPGMPLLVLDDEASLRIEAPIEESLATQVHLGDPVTVELGTPTSQLPGTIGEIVPAVDVRSRAFLVKVDVGKGELRPGAFARVGLAVGTRPRLVVPTSAIAPAGALDRVYVIDHGRARLRMITRGEAQGPWTEVLSGLAAGEAIVTDPPRDLPDGSRLETAS